MPASSQSTILDGLNHEQETAVVHKTGPLLIIAGAGTGKTTVVTRRIAQLITSGEARADQILALTFTDKAAGEMEERVDALLPMGYLDLWVSTFHAFGERVLKDHALDIGLSNDFRLLTDTDQWLLLRSHIDEFELDYYKPKGNPTKFVQALISHFSRLKDEDITPARYLAYAKNLNSRVSPLLEKKARTDEEQAQVDEAARVTEVAAAYERYQQLLREENAMDFGDLIVETIHLFNERPALLDKFRKQFKYILVDEFQDTNFAQYDLIKLLAAPENNLTVVADDDQSIYRFRGASMSNIVIFKKDFPEAEEVSLVQNYRSAQEILDLAHSFIQSNNPHRLEVSLDIDKRLKSNTKESAVIEHLHSQSLTGEAQLVMKKILELKEARPETSWSDFAILVRANDSAQAFIPYLERANVPYQFLASKGLFTKSVILDIIAVLKLLDDYHESRAMYRYLTLDLWGIAHEDVLAIMQHGSKYTESIYETCLNVQEVPSVSEAGRLQVEKLLGHLKTLTKEARYKSVGEIILMFLEQSGYLKLITNQEESLATENILYLNQFYKYVEAFEKAHSEKTVRNFVFELVAMIEAGEQGRLLPDLDEGPESVKIMTVHAAKGLEFECVFVVNLVDKRFPAIGRKEAIPVPEDLVKDVPQGDGEWHLEEERRLFYVAITRAKSGLFLTSGEDYGGVRKKKPSRFLVEAGFVDTRPEPTGEVVFQPVSHVSPELASRERSYLPDTFSFTDLDTYDVCPWKYRFRYVLKVPSKSGYQASFGKAVHNTLYEFFRRMKEHPSKIAPTLSDLLEIYEAKWIDEWFNSKKQRDNYKTKGAQMLEEFYDLHKAAWPSVLHLEERFRVPLGEYTIKGAIDRVDTVEGGVEVIDYKTGTPPKTGKKDQKQLYLYALALQQIFEEAPTKLTYYFLENNIELSTDFDAEKMQSVQEWALQIIEKIQSANFEPTPSQQVCKHCDYREICEYRK